MPYSKPNSIFLLQVAIAGLFAFVAVEQSGYGQQMMADPTVTPPSQHGQVPQQPPPPSPVTRSPDGTLKVGITKKRSLNMLQALVNETDVDWYSWYLDTRRYVQQMGGLPCPVGTLIVFNKGGRVETPSLSPECQVKVTLLYRKLPQNSSLDQLILPAIPANQPPRSKQELIELLKTSAYYQQ